MNPTHFNLPDRLTEKAFKRYEVVIDAAVQAHPNALFLPDDKQFCKAVTFVARLRDAMTSLKTYRWETFIDRQKFEENFELIRVVRHKYNLHKIVIGGSDAHIDEPAPIVMLPANASNPVIHLSTLDQKKLFAELASYNLVAKDITLTGISLADVDFLEENFDIAVKQNNDGTHTII